MLFLQLISLFQDEYEPYLRNLYSIKTLFGIVIMVVVQNVFHSEIHQNKVFYFSKIIFNINTLKRPKNIKLFFILNIFFKFKKHGFQPISNFKKLIFLKNHYLHHISNTPTNSKLNVIRWLKCRV